MKRIVIIGAGYAGILTAKKLAKKLKKTSDTEITIIDRNPFHTMLTELHEVAAGRVDEESIRIDLDKVFAGRKVNVRLDNVQSVDFDKKTVIGTANQYSYDYLVISAGSKPTFFGVPGAEEHSFKLWSYEDAVVLKEHIYNAFRSASREFDPVKKEKLLTFYIVGAGFTGVEMAGELAEYAPILCEKFGIDKREVKIVNVDTLDRVIPILPEKISAKAERRLKKMGVDVILGKFVCEIGDGFIDLREEDNCERFDTHTVIWTAGIQSADITCQAADSLQSAQRGRIKTDPYLRSLDNESVYIAGDNMYFVPEGETESVPQMVENCEQCAGVIANNIVTAITGSGSMKEYKPTFHGVMVCIGGRYGVAHVGFPNFMLNLPSFFAMLSKHFINIIYFIQVLGWNKVFSYLRHEFFTIRNNRSFVGGHLSNKTPSFLLMPLRVWLGCVWLFEGIMKVVEGWFTTPKLTGFFGGANAWYQSILGGISDAASAATDAVTAATGAAADAVTAATDAVTAATDAVTAATGATADIVTAATDAITAATDVATAIGTKIFSLNFGLFKAIFVSGKELAKSSLADYAFKLDVPLMNWFIDKAILPSDGMQLFMQGFIVLAEILVGLALIGGLFTTPASAFSIVLQFMFLCTTGLYLGSMWMIFAAIAVLIAGGRTLGLDYYAMPALKKLWKRIPLVRKLYIYND